ncbi:MAG: PepSY-like domain-containing protein [Flavobacterium sp.]
MKRIFLIGVFACFVNTVSAQDIPQSQVPSLVVNNFQQSFPKAFDVEWELKGNLYKAEFETGLLGTDHDVWYDKTGKLVRHRQEISKSDLPQKVLAKISSNFKNYRVEDVKKISEGNKITYTLELKSFSEEWKVAFDSEGTVLSKVAD